MESEAHSGGARSAVDEEAVAEAFEVGTAGDGQGVPGGAGGRDGSDVPAIPGDAVSRGVPGGSGDHANRRGPRAAGGSGGGAGAIPQIPGARHTPGPGGDAAPGAGVLINRAIQFSLAVPFTSNEEADIARHFLTPRTHLRGPIRRELDVNGRMLVLQLTTEDPVLLHTSIAFCLEQLSMVKRTLQHFVPPLYSKRRHRRGS